MSESTSQPIDIDYVKMLSSHSIPAVKIDVEDTPQFVEVNAPFKDIFDSGSIVGEEVESVADDPELPFNSVPQLELISVDQYTLDVVTCGGEAYLRTRLYHDGCVIDTFLSGEGGFQHHQHIKILHRVYRHNLRNSINAISGWNQLIKDELTDHNIPDEARKNIEKAVDNINERTEELSNISSEASELRNLLYTDSEFNTKNLETIITECVFETIPEYTNPNITVSIPSDIEIYCSNRFSLAITNIIDNAFRHNDSDVEVTIEVVNVTPNKVVLSLRDTGSKIPPSEAQIIRDGADIEQLNHGSGLGLWIIRWVLSNHNASLDFSTSAEGTEYKFTLYTPPTSQPETSQVVSKNSL